MAVVTARAKRDNKTITLGSGKVYVQLFVDSIPEDVTSVCTDSNLLGLIKGGAALEYKEETYEEKDDLNLVSKIITTNEEATLKLGLITWNGMTLQKLIDRCKTTESGNKRITKIGGAGNAQGKYYVIVFHHEDKADGDVWVALVGRNTAGASLSFATDSGTQVEPEFKAMPHDEDGTLIQLIEELDAA